MFEDPKLNPAPVGAPEEVNCIFCGHECHHGMVCSVPNCNCSDCQHDIEEVDDITKLINNYEE